MPARERTPPRAFLVAASAAALVLAACTGSGSNRAEPVRGERSGPKPELTSLERLPERHREVLAAYGRGGPEWEQRREEVRADPALAKFLVDNLVLELVRAHEAMSVPGDRRGRLAFERAQAELARLPEAAAPVLVELLTVADGIVATLATDALERVGRDAIEPALPLLDSKDVVIRRRAAALFARLPHGARDEQRVLESLTEHLRKDPDWVMRAECATAVAERGARDRATGPARKALERALFDEDAAVGEASARGLGRIGDLRATPALLQALERAQRAGDVRRLAAVQGTLGQLAGDRRARDLEAWRAWWKEAQRDLVGDGGTDR